MGATTYEVTAKGKNVREVFNKLVEDALYTSGHDSYNGTISTTQLGRKLSIPTDILKNKKKLEDFIYDENNDSFLYREKWSTSYVDLGVCHYEAFTPQWREDIQTLKKKKGVTTINKFSITVKGENYSQKEFIKLSEAKKIAKEYAIRLQKDITIYKFRSDGSKFRIGNFLLTSDGKKYKSARISKTKLYLPVNEYIFFVYAAC